MSGPRPSDLEQAEQGRIAQRTLEDLRPTLAEKRRQVEEQVFAVLRDPRQTLSAEQAVQAWIRLFESRELEKALEGRVRRGRDAARRADSDS